MSHEMEVSLQSSRSTKQGEFHTLNREVRIGKGLRPFPPSKRSGRVSPHCAFQYSDQHPQVSLGVGRRMRFPSRAHQLEHSTTRCMGSPALPGNKAPLLFPSFAFSGKSLSSRFRFLSLADLHHVPALTAERWATTPPPPSLPHAGIFASPCGARWFESSPVPVRKLRVPRSMPALRRVDQRQHVHVMPKRHTPHHPFWARCLSHFHLL